MKSALSPKFLILWSGQLLSGLGSGMTAFALGVYVFKLTGSAAGFAMVILCQFLPSILLRPPGGVLADRFDRRIMIVFGDAGSSLGVIFLLIGLLSGSLTLWEIYLGIIISSSFTALRNPAYKASVSDLLKEEQYSRAGGLLQLAGSAHYLLSPLAAGFLLSAANLQTVLIVDLFTFAAAISAAAVLKKPVYCPSPAKKPGMTAELKEGWRTLRDDREVIKLVGILSLVTFFAGFLQTLYGPMMLSITDAKTLGFSQSISAAGMLLCSLLLGLFTVKEQKKVLLYGLRLGAVSMTLMGVSGNIAWITAAFFLFFCSLPLINTNAEVLIRKSIPHEKQGRVWGIIGFLSQLGYLFAYLCSGILADLIFNPLLAEDGALATSLGTILGTGPGRGIGLMLIIAGTGLGITAIASGLQEKKPGMNTPAVIYIQGEYYR